MNNNSKIYRKSDVVEHYAQATGLLAPEQYLFAKYLRPGMDVMDIGVGGGRTTPFLVEGAKSYLGADYSPSMVDACRKRFPAQEFICLDATDMKSIADNSFDLVVFSFNGIDYIATDAGRVQALRELRRVTRPDGHIIISSHNARQLMSYPPTSGVGPFKAMWRILYSLARAPGFLFRNVASGAFKNGHGYIADPVHGGLYTHVSTPASIARDAAAAQLQIVETADAHHPRKLPQFLNNWTTYVLKRA